MAADQDAEGFEGEPGDVSARLRRRAGRGLRAGTSCRCPTGRRPPGSPGGAIHSRVRSACWVGRGSRTAPGPRRRRSCRWGTRPRPGGWPARSGPGRRPPRPAAPAGPRRGPSVGPWRWPAPRGRRGGCAAAAAGAAARSRSSASGGAAGRAGGHRHRRLPVVGAEAASQPRGALGAGCGPRRPGWSGAGRRRAAWWARIEARSPSANRPAVGGVAERPVDLGRRRAARPARPPRPS